MKRNGGLCLAQRLEARRRRPRIRSVATPHRRQPTTAARARLQTIRSVASTCDAKTKTVPERRRTVGDRAKACQMLATEVRLKANLDVARRREGLRVAATFGVIAAGQAGTIRPVSADQGKRGPAMCEGKLTAGVDPTGCLLALDRSMLPCRENECFLMLDFSTHRQRFHAHGPVAVSAGGR